MSRFFGKSRRKGQDRVKQQVKWNTKSCTFGGSQKRAYNKQKLPQISRKWVEMLYFQNATIFRTNIVHILACFNAIYVCFALSFFFIPEIESCQTYSFATYFYFLLTNQYAQDIFPNRLTSFGKNSIVFHHMETA